MKDLPEQPEHVRGKPAALVIAATAVAIVLCAVVVWLMQPANNGAQNTGVFAPDFDTTTVFEQRRAAQAASLDTWTWADTGHTRVRMPVGAAIDRYLAHGGSRDSGGTQ